MHSRRSLSQTAALLIVCLLVSIAFAAQFDTATIVSSGTVVRLDRWVTWNDGSVEHIVLGMDGFLVLNGTKRRLVGFDVGTTGLQIAFWDPADLAIIEKELSYLQSIGVRLITLDLYYVGLNNEQSRYSPILNLLRAHKMLVFPVITGKSLPGCNNLTVPDFPISGGYGDDSMGNWTLRWVDVVKNYSNVVAISVENELDCPNPGQYYSGEQVFVYLDFLEGIVRSRTNLPITSKQYFTTWSDLEVKRAILAEAEFPTDTDYSINTTDHENRLDRWTTFLGENNRSVSGWWTGEINIFNDSGIDTPNFTVEYIEQAFNHGGSVVCLWTMNRYQQPGVGFFDANGDPTNALLNIAPQLPILQS